MESVKILFIEDPRDNLQIFAMMSEKDYRTGQSIENKIYWHSNDYLYQRGPFQSIYHAWEDYKAKVISKQLLNIHAVPPILPINTVPTKDNIIDMAEWKANRYKAKNIKANR